MLSSPSSPGPLPLYGSPHTLQANKVRFQARHSTRQALQPATEQVHSGRTDSGPSHPEQTPPGSGHPRQLPSVVLGRALPENGGPTDFSDRDRTTGSTLVVIEQPDQPADVQVLGALSAYPPPSTISDYSDNRDGFDTDIEAHPTLGSGLTWYFRLFGIVGGAALMVPGALMLAMANQTEAPQGPRVQFFSKFLSGFMITSGSAITALATASGLKALYPNFSARIASGLGARFGPQAPMAAPVVMELPAAHPDAAV